MLFHGSIGHIASIYFYHIIVDNIAKILPCDKTYEFCLE